MNDLKPCPFCGHNNFRFVIATGLVAIECECCDVSGPCYFHKTESIEHWNQRAEPWIPHPANDPSEDGEYWVILYDGRCKPACWEMCTDQAGRWFNALGDLIYDVTHFLKIPDLPKDL